MAGLGCFKGRNSDSAAMASGPPDVMEPAEVGEECSGKKKSKFQTFKKFFARKKRKEPSSSGADAGLKASQSSDNVSKTSENNTLTRSEKDKGSGSKISLGSKALSHDSVFVSDSSEANEALGASQDSIHGKVKSLQLQLKQAIRLGSPPSLMCVKKTDDAGTMSEDDGLPCSPPEYTTPNTTLNQAQRNSSISLEGTDSEEDQLSCAASSRAVSPLVVVPGDFSQPASPFGCLDNSAAKHKMGLRQKACNKRKPANRLELKAERDSVVKEILNTSFPDSLEEREEQKTRDASGDELKLKVEKEEEEVEKEEEEEEKEQPQHSRETLLRDKEEREEGEDESEAEQDVSHGLDTSSPPEPCPSEEEAADAQLSSKLGSRASSLDSPRATPEPPADQREYLQDPPGITYETEETRDDENPTLEKGGEVVQETGEEGGSFLQEVLSSLKTPLAPCSLGAETEAVLEIKEEKDKEEAEGEEREEVKEEDTEVEEPVGYQAAPSGSLLLGQSTEEEEEEAATTSCQDDEEENKDEEELEAEEEQQEVERFIKHSQEDVGEKEEAEEVKPEEENDLLQRKMDQQVEEEEEDQSEGEEETMELEKEPEVEEEGLEKSEEDDVVEEVEVEVEVEEEKERVEEAEEEERDDAEEMMEMFPDAAGGEVHSVAPSQEADEGADVAVGDDAVCVVQHTDDDEIPAELDDQESATVHESQAASNQNSEDERNDEERAEEGVEIDHMEQKSDQEEDVEANQADVNETELDLEQESVEEPDSKHVEKDQSEVNQSAPEQVSSKPSSLSLQESHFETPSEESMTSPNTATTTIHINLVSPSSEKAAFSFQQSPTAADPEVTESPSHAGAATEQITASTDEESANKVEDEEEQRGKQSSEEDATPPTSVEETVNQSSGGSDQSKVRFTINSAWQRSLSIEDAEDNVAPTSSPTACVSSSSSTIAGAGGVDVVATAKKDPQVETEPASSAKVELVLSPGRARNAGSTTAKPQSTASQAPVKPPASAAGATEESSVVVEGNPDSPFGVRLRKTVALHRFSSEEENTELPVEPPAQPTSCKVESPQPVSVKPSISQPISNKPALPKKPEVHGDSGVKPKRVSDSAAVRGVSGGSGSPSWISVAKQKQKIYKENSLEEITVKKEEQERKSSLPMYVSSAASREQSNKTPESTSKVSPLEISKPSVSVEKETRRALSPPTPVPPQPPKSQSLPCPVAPKPQLPPAPAKHPPPPTPAQRSLSPPTPVPVPQKPPSCTSPTSLAKTATSSKTPQAQSTTLTSPPFSSRTASPQSGSRAPALSGQTPSTQRGLPPPDSPQDEPPWMALAKKKAKAWSEMPQIVQ
ncbi:capping protein-inhibiting regulator of actin dynamics isoform X3 [Thunnus albacares]|uniref:capping protein-inhibiting regulator of actin dynamics isoform X3 n=1 Tax=Thunnus albacares TaxID=8236 RepID=UPI001CF66B37|nr:capping protein-inhibiting regulator of actin dynamics isoform X3 [Thunnus albacares]